LDKILLERATLTLGHKRTSDLLKSYKTELQIKGLESIIANIAAKQESSRLEQHSFRLEVLELLKKKRARPRLLCVWAVAMANHLASTCLAL